MQLYLLVEVQACHLLQLKFIVVLQPLKDLQDGEEAAQLWERKLALPIPIDIVQVLFIFTNNLTLHRLGYAPASQ